MSLAYPNKCPRLSGLKLYFCLIGFLAIPKSAVQPRIRKCKNDHIMPFLKSLSKFSIALEIETQMIKISLKAFCVPDFAYHSRWATNNWTSPLPLPRTCPWIKKSYISWNAFSCLEFMGNRNSYKIPKAEEWKSHFSHIGKGWAAVSSTIASSKLWKSTCVTEILKSSYHCFFCSSVVLSMLFCSSFPGLCW